jgi:hypothetical protein
VYKLSVVSYTVYIDVSSTIVVKKLYDNGVVLASSTIVAVPFYFLYCIYVACPAENEMRMKYNMVFN